jgi:HlyD family secretion protein
MSFSVNQSLPPKGARSTKKILFWLFVLVLIAGAGFGYFLWNKAHAQPHYVTADVTRGDVERSVSVTGSINPRTTVQVGSYVSGTVKTLSCDFNTQVKAGQVCATIDPSTFQVAVDQAAAQLNSSKAQLQKDEAALVYAKGVADRDVRLLKDGVVAQEVADNDKNIYKQAQSQIDLDKASIVAAQANLKSAEVNLGYTKIVSPVTGTVLTRNIDVGQTVASSLQTPTLFLIGKDMKQMQVDANVSEADVGRIQVGQDVSFSVQAYPDKTFEGKVKQIRRGPITVQNVVTYDVVVTVDNPDLLLFPGMTADAEIVTDSRDDVLRVPLAATRFTPEGTHMSDFPRAAGDGGKRKHDADAAASASASVSASSSAAASAPQQQAQGERHHHGDGQGGAGRWQRRNDGSGADDPERAERRRAWMREHGAEFAGRGGDGSGHGGWRHRQEDQQAADKKPADDKDDDAKDGKDAKPLAKTGKNDKDKTTDKADDKPVDMTDTLATTAPTAPPPRKRARVWVMRDGKPVPVSIVIGLDDGDTVEVIDGDLKPGDKVIVNEVRPVETAASRNTPMPSPFGQGGRGPRGGVAGGARR